MNKSTLKKYVSLGVAVLLCIALLAGCGSKLSSDFDENEVKKAAENVIALINSQDSEGLKELCTVQMKNALTDDVLKQVYEGIGEGGAFQEIVEMKVAGTTNKESKEELAVVVVKAKYEIKQFTYTISFTKQMKLSGLYFR